MKSVKTNNAQLKSSHLLDMERIKFENRAFHNSFLTRLHQERKEAETEAACTRAKESQGWRLEEVKQDDLLAQELAKDKLKNLCEMKIRENLRNSEELKELDRALSIAYIQKELAAQLEEKKAEKLKEKCREKEEQRLLIEQEKLCEEYDNYHKMQSLIKKFKYKDELQDQLINRQKVKEMEYKKELEEKTLIEDALRTIFEEDQKEEELKMFKKQKSKEDTEAMLAAKKEWMKLEKKNQEEEYRKIKEYLETKTEQERQLQEHNKIREELRIKARQACIDKILITEGERKERDRISQILLDEDTRKKEDEALKRASEHKRKSLQEFKEVTAQQIEHRIQTTEKDKQNDIIFSRQLLEENEKALRREKENITKKKLQNVEHGQSLKQLIEQQHLKKIRDVEMIHLENVRQLEANKQKQQLLAEERIKTLKKHTPNLIGYLPKGVIDQSDLQHLDAEVQKFYKKENK